MVWARKEDRNDLLKLGSTPLPDNEATAKYLYEIVVYTGDKDGAATDSKIQLYITAILGVECRKLFRRPYLAYIYIFFVFARTFSFLTSP